MKNILSKIRERFQQRCAPCNSEAGFTLVEMMIVVAIIGLIMGVVGSNLMKKLDESKVETTKMQIRQLGLALQDFRRVCGFYPTTEQGLEALISPPVGGRECKNYGEGFLTAKKIPQDAWDNDFIYFSDGNKFEIRSLGQDQAEGGTGIAADISSDDQ